MIPNHDNSDSGVSIVAIFVGSFMRSLVLYFVEFKHSLKYKLYQL